MTDTTSEYIPFESPLRTQPIHPSLPNFKVSSTNSLPPYSYNPLTNTPWTTSELESESIGNMKSLITEHPGQDSAKEAQMLAIGELNSYLEANDSKRREVEKELQEAEQTRALERKIFENMKNSKKSGGEKSGKEEGVFD